MILKTFYSDIYEVPLPEGHRFPMCKYKKLRDRLIEESLLGPANLFKAPLASVDKIKLAHCSDYVDRVAELRLSVKEHRPIGLPQSKEMWIRTLGSTGGFVAACEAALENGISSTLAGGTHHAHYDRGEGFCFFNDFAVAIRSLQQMNPKMKFLILDLDVHQGNGNSSMLGDDPNVRIISFHGEKNFPFRKIPSSLDIALPNDCTDADYLQLLDEVLFDEKRQQYDLIMYQAGVDALEHDKLGTLKISYDGLMMRDKKVFEFAREVRTPMVMALGGGYSNPIDYTVEACVNTYRALKKVFDYKST